MMPSRGLHLAKGNAPRLFQLQCRNLSSASRRIPSTPYSNALSLRTPSTPWRTSIPILTFSIQAVRNASTNTPASEPAASTNYVPEPSSFPNMDTITLDNIDLSNPKIPAHIAAIPEKIGYLHEIGLNYGWGPTSMLEWTIEHIHIYGGLPWWGSIAATAVLLRLALLPYFIKSSDSMARTQALVSVTKPVTDRMTACQKAGDTEGMKRAWTEVAAIRKRAGVSFRAQFTPMILQGVFGYCGLKLFRAAANLPVPGFKDGGFLWLSDLTVPDPYLILPVVMAGCIHLLIRIGGETGAMANPMSSSMQNILLYGMPAIIVVSVGFLPGAVAVWFAAGGALGIVQSLLLQRPAVREWLKIAPLYKPTPEERDMGPMQTLMQSMKKAEPTTKARPTGKNAAYMHPTYQSPNLRNNSTARSSQHSNVIDVQAVPASTRRPSTGAPSSADNMIPPSGSPSAKSSSPGVFDRASTAWQNYKQRLRDTQSRLPKNTPQGRAERDAKAFIAEKKAHERRAKDNERKGLGRTRR